MFTDQANPTAPPTAHTESSGSSFILPPSSFQAPPHAPPAGPDFTPSPIHPFTPSSLDASLLTALFTPSTDLQATATAHGLSLLGLAYWLAQPHLQAQIELIESLRALQHQVWADQLRQEAADSLREALRDAPDPAERRRCAHTLLRAIATPRAPSLPRAASQAVPARSPAPTASAHEATHAPNSPNTPNTPPPEAPDGAQVVSPGRPESAAGGRSEPGVSTLHTPEPPKGAKAPFMELEAQASVTPPLDASIPSSLDPSAPPLLDASIPRSLDPSIPPPLDASIPRSLDPSPSPYHQALATLRACGHDTTEDELTDDQLDALEDAEADALEDPEFDDEFDAGLDAGHYEYPENLTGSGIAHALTLADGHLAIPHDTS